MHQARRHPTALLPALHFRPGLATHIMKPAASLAAYLQPSPTASSLRATATSTPSSALPATQLTLTSFSRARTVGPLIAAFTTLWAGWLRMGELRWTPASSTPSSTSSARISSGPRVRSSYPTPRPTRSARASPSSSRSTSLSCARLVSPALVRRQLSSKSVPAMRRNPLHVTQAWHPLTDCTPQRLSSISEPGEEATDDHVPATRMREVADRSLRSRCCMPTLGLTTCTVQTFVKIAQVLVQHPATDEVTPQELVMPVNPQPPCEAGMMAGTQLQNGSDEDGTDGTARVQLACFHCRVKRIRCSGTKPVCMACTKAAVACEWPAGRRRKRTRREMEEARREAAQKVRIEEPHGTTEPSTESAVTEVAPLVPPLQAWSTGSYLWPSNSLPIGLTSGLTDLAGGFDSDATALSLDPFAGFLTENSPGTDLRLLNKLNQTAYLSGDGSADDPLELFYYRLSGSTSINPGVHRISLRLQRRPGALGAPEPVREEEPLNDTPNERLLAATPASDLFDDNGLPHRHVWDPLFDKFLANMSSHFPSVSRKRMSERYDSGTMSAFLANCICALGARFGESQNAEGDNLAACAPFITKAEQLVVPLLHLPAHDVCTGLLLLAWASYGQNSDAGLWQYSGMSIRMAIDLGINEQSDIYESAQHVIRVRLLFWSLYITDTVLAFSTGRPTTIAEDTIEIPLPEDTDFFPDSSRDNPLHPNYLPNEQVQAVPFVYLVRLMTVTARIANILNGRRGRARTLVAADGPLSGQLPELQARLVDFYAALPETMRWSAENFKTQLTRGHGSTFLTLHLWAHAVLALVYHPDLLRSPSGVETPLNASMSRNIRLASVSSRQISECLVFADLVSHASYTASPFVVQPLYIAAMALVHEMRAASTAEDSVSSSDVFLATITKQNLSALLRAIGRTEGYWAGASYVANTLEKRSGMSRSQPKALRGTFISLPDRGLLRRFQADRDHPANIAPPTDTSLRDSIVRGQEQSPLWVSDLLSGYSVEDMSFAPAGSIDFERLMDGAGARVEE